MVRRLGRPKSGWRHAMYVIIFEADTKWGKIFDEILILSIILSVSVVFLDSVESISREYSHILTSLEWMFTILFTIEYILRILCVQKPWRYITSFFGIVDLIALLPTYLGFFIPEAQSFIDIRILRLLRIFRIFKLTGYIGDSNTLIHALRAAQRKITVFVITVLILIVVLATIMYVIEGKENGFSSIPTAFYWAIVTLTTVGYGDIVPGTPIGKAIASAIMLLGYGIIAVPTGIVSAEFTSHSMRFNSQMPPTTRTCKSCLTEGHEADAQFCRHCGSALPEYAYDGH